MKDIIRRMNRHYPPPKSYEKMVQLAERLAAGLPFVRVDFYEIGGHPYFGELTLYPGNGFEEFSPEEYDKLLGAWIRLPGNISTNYTA